MRACVVVHGPDPSACVAALESQRRAPDEILVVDAIDQQAIDRATRAGADIVAFLDARSVPEADWLGELLLPYDEQGVVGVAGRSQTPEDESRAGLADVGRLLPDGRLTHNFSADPGRVIAVDHVPGDNASFRSDVLRSAHPEHRIWPTELSLRATTGGAQLRYAPNAVVRAPANARPSGPAGIDRGRIFRSRRDHVHLLARLFGRRHPIVRHHARTVLLAQREYVWLARSHARARKLTGEQRTVRERLGAVRTLTGAAADTAGLVAGLITRGTAPGPAAHRAVAARDGSPVATTRATTARSIRIDGISPEDLRRWEELTDRAVEPNPFFHPDFLLASARWYETARELRVVVVEQDDRWLAMLPLSDMGRFRGSPFRYAGTAGRFLGRRASLCVPLLDREHMRAGADALLTFLRSRRSGPGLLELTLLPADGEVLRELTRAARRRRLPVRERSRFSRAYATRAEADVPLTRSHMKQLGRHERGLARDAGGELTFEDISDQPDALERLLSLEAAGWKGEMGSAVACKLDKRGWFTQIAEAFATRGAFRVFALTSGGRDLYVSSVYRSGDTGFGVLDAYDEEFAKHSPGQIGRRRELEHLLGDPGIRAYDPCMHPKYVASSRLYPHRRELVSILIGTKSSGRMLLAGVALADHVRGRLARARRRAAQPASSEQETS